MSSDKEILLTVKRNTNVRLWSVPNFVPTVEPDGTSLPVAQLDRPSLDLLVQAWVDKLYEKAGQSPPKLVRS